MKNMHRILNCRSMSALNFLVFTVLGFGQSSDPDTGEFFLNRPDTLMSAPDNTPVQTYDPETGEIIEDVAPSTEVVQNPVLIQQFDPLTGLPISSLNAPSICVQAKIDAIKNTSPLWYAGGVFWIIGLPAYFVAPPKPDVKNFKHMTIDDSALYVDCFIKAAQDERSRRMLTGCGVYVGYIFFNIVVLG